MRLHIYRRFPWIVPLLALVLASALAGCAASSSTSVGPAPTATTAPQGTPKSMLPSPVVGSLDPAPTDCATVLPPHQFTSTTFGGGFFGETTFQGGAPTWELGLGSGPLHLNELSVPTLYPSTKVMWVVGPNYAKPVTLTGHDLRSGTALWFEIYPGDPLTDSVYTASAMLDPSGPNRGSTDNDTGHWNIWGIGIIVLKAGCYELDVSSQQGSWHTIFAAGR